MPLSRERDRSRCAVTDLCTPVWPGHKCVHPDSSTRSCPQCCDRSLPCTPHHQTECTHLHLRGGGDVTRASSANQSFGFAAERASSWVRVGVGVHAAGRPPTSVALSCQLLIGGISTEDIALPRGTHLLELV